MEAGADAGRAEIELAGIGFGIGDELRNGHDRKRRIYHQHMGHAHDAGDRLDVADEIEGKLLIERVIDRVGGNDLEQRIAVRWGLNDRLGSEIATAPGRFSTMNGWPSRSGSQVAHQPSQDVGGRWPRQRRR